MRRALCLVTTVFGVWGAACAGVAAASWTIESSPTPDGPAASLTGVSCTTAASCVAVGTSFTSGFAHQVPLAEQRRAGVWRIRPVPAPAGSSGALLSGVSCHRRSCTAVGSTLGIDGSKVLVERWNGASWMIQSAPSPPGLGTSGLSAVSCPSVNRCKAVGRTQGQYGSPAALAESWNGHSWSIDPTPPLSDGLSGVSCTSPNACAAVGSVATNDGLAAIAERWNGHEWTVQSTPAVAPGNNLTTLNAVSCAASLACTAVGESGNDSHGLITSTLAEAWRGHAWFIQPTFSLGISALNGVSCTRPDACTAVGGDEAAPNGGTTIQRFNGREWLAQRNPLDNAPATLSSVSCPTLRSCTAVGGSPTLTTLVERYAGS